MGSRTALSVAIAAATQAGAIARKAFGSRLTVETKADASPVTAIDRACEETMRRIVTRAFPADGFLGEEFGSTRPDAEIRWIIDPIDGTKSYVRGMPFWGCMIAREVRGRVDLGVLALPVQGSLLWATRGGGAFLDGRRLRVSRIGSLAKATVLCGDLDLFHRRKAFGRLAALARRAGTLRSLGDCTAYRWVAGGQAEAMVESTVGPWDVAALKVIVEEAGGRLTDWRGRDSHLIANVVASNGRVHPTLVRLLRRRG